MKLGQFFHNLNSNLHKCAMPVIIMGFGAVQTCYAFTNNNTREEVFSNPKLMPSLVNLVNLHMMTTGKLVLNRLSDTCQSLKKNLTPQLLEENTDKPFHYQVIELLKDICMVQLPTLMSSKGSNSQLLECTADMCNVMGYSAYIYDEL